VIDVPRERFEELVGDALDGIPPELGRHIDNVAVFVEEVAPEGGLLGRYEGIPLTKRDSGYGAYGNLVMPDRITLYRRPLCALARTEQDVIEQVRVTVVHEIAHHFGIDDDRLSELGYG
jgi:predicted Zn-dependent protease with MMP-like domain